MDQVQLKKLDSVLNTLFEELETFGKDTVKYRYHNLNIHSSCKLGETVNKYSMKHSNKDVSDKVTVKKEHSESLRNRDKQTLTTNRRNDLVLSTRRNRHIPDKTLNELSDHNKKHITVPLQHGNTEHSGISLSLCKDMGLKVNNEQCESYTKQVKNLAPSDDTIRYVETTIHQSMKETNGKNLVSQNNVALPWKHNTVSVSSCNLSQNNQQIQGQGHIDLKPSIRKRSAENFQHTPTCMFNHRNNKPEDQIQGKVVKSVISKLDVTPSYICYKQRHQVSNSPCQLLVEKKDFNKEPGKTLDLQPSFRRSRMCAGDEIKKVRKDNNIDNKTSGSSDDSRKEGYLLKDKGVNKCGLFSKAVDGQIHQQQKLTRISYSEGKQSYISERENVKDKIAYTKTCDLTCTVKQNIVDPHRNKLLQDENSDKSLPEPGGNGIKFCTNQKLEDYQNNKKCPAQNDLKKASKRKRNNSASDKFTEMGKKMFKGTQLCSIKSDSHKVKKVKKGRLSKQKHKGDSDSGSFSFNTHQFIHKIHKTIAESSDVRKKEFRYDNDGDKIIDRIIELENIIPLSSVSDKHVRTARVKLERQKGTLTRHVTKSTIWTTVNSKY